MQFLAIMKANPDLSPEDLGTKIKGMVKEETLKAWQMTQADVIRTLWYIPGDSGPNGTIALLECSDRQEAEAQCQQFPFVINGIVTLDLITLTPCDAYELLFESQYKAKS